MRIQPGLVTRRATHSDIPNIVSLMSQAITGMPFSPDQIAADDLVLIEFRRAGHEGLQNGTLGQENRPALAAVLVVRTPVLFDIYHAGLSMRAARDCGAEARKRAQASVEKRCTVRFWPDVHGLSGECRANRRS